MSEAKQATPRAQLLAEIMDPNFAKNEHGWAAADRIAALERFNNALEEERRRLADELFDMRNRYGCGPEQSGPDALERIAALEEELERQQIDRTTCFRAAEKYKRRVAELEEPQDQQNCPRKYVTVPGSPGIIYCLHGTSSISAYEALTSKYAALEAKTVELEKQLIYGFYEDEQPEYRQGPAVHELQDLMTAEEANGLVKAVNDHRRRAERLAGACSSALEQVLLMAKDPENNWLVKELRAALADEEKKP